MEVFVGLKAKKKKKKKKMVQYSENNCAGKLSPPQGPKEKGVI